MSTPMMSMQSKQGDPLKRSVDRKADLQSKIRSGEIQRNIKVNQKKTQVIGENG